MRFLSLLILCLLTVLTSAQPFTLTISPENPNTQDSIYVEVGGFTGGVVYVDSNYIDLVGDSIQIVEHWCHDCYFLILNYFSRNYTLDPFPAGTYQLSFIVNRFDYKESECTGTYLCTETSMISAEFTVSEYVNIEEQEDKPLRLNPNPASDKLNIEWLGKVQMSIFSMDGKIILDEFFYDRMQVNVSSWDPGIYLLKLRDENGKLLSRKFIVYR